jgi:hypothetical protein
MGGVSFTFLFTSYLHVLSAAVYLEFLNLLSYTPFALLLRVAVKKVIYPFRIFQVSKSLLCTFYSGVWQFGSLSLEKGLIATTFSSAITPLFLASSCLFAI